MTNHFNCNVPSKIWFFFFFMKILLINAQAVNTAYNDIVNTVNS